MTSGYLTRKRTLADYTSRETATGFAFCLKGTRREFTVDPFTDSGLWRASNGVRYVFGASATDAASRFIAEIGP